MHLVLYPCLHPVYIGQVELVVLRNCWTFHSELNSYMNLVIQEAVWNRRTCRVSFFFKTNIIC